MFMRFFVLCVMALLAENASAQTSRTIKLVVPVPPGASTDFAARLLGDQISRMQGVTVLVENRPGASGMIGTEAVSRRSRRQHAPGHRQHLSDRRAGP